MMDWLLSIDTDLFRFINHSLVNPVFDWIMPRMAGHPLFLPVVLLAGFLLLWKGGRRGRIFVLLLAMGIGLTDGIVCNSIKKLVGRPRPCAALADTRALIGCGQAGSMPSSHAANWSAAAVVFFVFYRRSWRVMAPMAATIAFSRVYNGVHYPSDRVAGVVLGGGSAGPPIQGAIVFWSWKGRPWFTFLWRDMPSLICTEARAAPSGSDEKVPGGEDAGQWLRLGYVVIATSLVFRLAYIGSGTIELSKDEAYQWLWSKHLALSYYSKPPGIALIQFAGTHLWRDTTFGVRFFSPMFAALLSLVMLRFMAREVGARQGFLLLLIVTCAPLMSLGTILMTIDPPLVLCWTLAMIAGWRAIQPDGRIRHWLLAGVAAGLGFLSKYTALYLVVCWALFFLLWKPARVHLRKPGPYLLLLVLGVSTIPVILWNSQHDWITAQHVAHNAGMEAKWKPTLRFFGEFLGIEACLLNPVFFVGA